MFCFLNLNLRRYMKALINRSAQMQFDGYGVMMDKRRGLTRRPRFTSASLLAHGVPESGQSNMVNYVYACRTKLVLAMGGVIKLR